MSDWEQLAQWYQQDAASAWETCEKHRLEAELWRKAFDEMLMAPVAVKPLPDIAKSLGGLVREWMSGVNPLGGDGLEYVIERHLARFVTPPVSPAPDADMAVLIEKLKKVCEHALDMDWPFAYHAVVKAIDTLKLLEVAANQWRNLHEADAAALSQLRAELDDSWANGRRYTEESEKRLGKLLNAAVARAETAEADNKRLRAELDKAHDRLTPFAQVVSGFMDTKPDADFVNVELGWCRAAYAALAGGQHE